MYKVPNNILFPPKEKVFRITYKQNKKLLKQKQILLSVCIFAWEKLFTSFYILSTVGFQLFHFNCFAKQKLDHLKICCEKYHQLIISSVHTNCLYLNFIDWIEITLVVCTCLTCLFWYQTWYSTEFSFTFPSSSFSYYFYRCCCYFFEEVTKLFRCNWFFLKKTMSAIKLHVFYAVISWVHIELA